MGKMAKSMKKKPIWGVWEMGEWLPNSFGEPEVFFKKTEASQMSRFNREFNGNSSRVRRIGWYDPEPLKEKKT